MLERRLFTADHELFRDTVRRFIAAEITPHHDHWEEQGYVDRELWLKAGQAGLLCLTMPEQYGGAGADRLYSTIMIEGGMICPKVPDAAITPVANCGE